jgi:hypothetical protein
MLIAPGLVASLLVTPAVVLPAAGVSPMIVNVIAASDLSPALVSALLEEAAAIWRPAGVTFIWNRARSLDGQGVRVLVGGGTRAGSDMALPLGWINFDDDKTPEREIYISYTNAVMLLNSSRGVIGSVEAMPIAQRNIYLARAMGRALAHELGHYLLASKRHSETGIMRARHSSTELFGPTRQVFTIDDGARKRLAARFAHQTRIASTMTP